ncbi:curli production assembly/transport component CsgG [Loktanella sp. DSM 29012]|uniref:CsgG/HfaB family protein n=1 Tax=Loktanella sp. DSM 29012 TaxID=1881056 RepID=UPI0008B2FF05|nr:CsgG/HfaB family protein [Loktanella sp. DSM 29012]SEQ37810.1 curli production assembly/transport component CsgG [Loktanella sp. DSM 29012]
MRIAPMIAVCLVLAGCNTLPPVADVMTQPAELAPMTRTGFTVENLPPPRRPIDVAVYAFPDLSGANEPVEDFASLSRAVTQGGAHLLVDVLSDVGNGRWFAISERTGVDNLLRERQIIEQTQNAYQGVSTLPPLRFAGTLIEGAIVGYDSNDITGGVGASFLGIGSSVEYRRDVVTVSMRAVSVSNGRVLASTTTTKTVYSALVRNGLFQFTSVDKFLEIESGYSRNEPEIFAVKEALELGVLSLILDGVESGEWVFANPQQGQEILNSFKRLEEQRFALR